MSEKPNQSNGSDIVSLLLVAVLSIIGSIAIVYYFLVPQMQNSEEPIPLNRLPILYVNLGEVVAGYSDIRDESQRRQKMESVAQKLRELRQAGFIVLDANAIITAPEEIAIDKNLLLNSSDK